MKFGVKTYDDESFLKAFDDSRVDFFEVSAIKGNDYSFLKNFSKPIVIHAEHQAFGTNIADKSRFDINLKSLRFAQKVADMVGSKTIIVHPGFLIEGDSNTSLQNAIDFLKEANDERIVVENLPSFGKSFGENGFYLGSTFEEIKEIMENANVGFCFDLNHGIDALYYSKKDILEGVRKFLSLSPRHFHIGGQRFVKNKDIGHLCLREFDYSWKEIFAFYPKDANLTLEVGLLVEEIERDLEFLKSLKV